MRTSPEVLLRRVSCPEPRTHILSARKNIYIYFFFTLLPSEARASRKKFILIFIINRPPTPGPVYRKLSSP
jgi:hypothetical protein